MTENPINLMPCKPKLKSSLQKLMTMIRADSVHGAINSACLFTFFISKKFMNNLYAYGKIVWKFF
jgi:hypothetical protein